MAGPTYPFEPRSTAYLMPGQFWGVPLSDGRWACGRVLAVSTEPDRYFSSSRRMFLAALMDWSGDERPTADAIAGSTVVEQGWAHVRTIRENGRLVLGHRDLALDGIRAREVTRQGGSAGMLYEDGRPLRRATAEEVAMLPVHETWGFQVISVAAEQLFVERAAGRRRPAP